jgi:transposase
MANTFYFVLLIIITDSFTKKIISHGSEECTVVSSMRPVYLCMNAIQQGHECTYAMCYSCKMTEDEEIVARKGSGNVKRRSNRIGETQDEDERKLRERMNSKYDNDNCLDTKALKSICRHSDRNTLVPFTMGHYFTTRYQEKIRSDEIAFPIKCNMCRLTLRKG